MLVEDTTAYIEKIEVPGHDRQAARIRQRLAHAELELLEAQSEVRMASEAVAAMELAAQRGRRRQHAGFLRLRKAEGPSSRAIASVRARLKAKQRELERRQEHYARLQADAQEDERRQRLSAAFRLHSRHHFLECSASRFDSLARAQRDTPVLVARREGRRWWWHSDRFWWDDAMHTRNEVKALVLELDLERRRPTADAERLSALLAGRDGSAVVEVIPDELRRVVWRRDAGRCADCGATDGLSFGYIIPLARGGSQTAANVELRCTGCSARRSYNELRASTSRARLDAEPRHVEDVAPAVRLEVWHRDGGICVDCGSRDEVDVDHIVSVAKGGSNAAENLELRCDTCRSRRAQTERAPHADPGEAADDRLASSRRA